MCLYRLLGVSLYPFFIVDDHVYETHYFYSFLSFFLNCCFLFDPAQINNLSLSSSSFNSDMQDIYLGTVSLHQILMVAWTAEAAALGFSLPHTYLRTCPRGERMERQGQLSPAL